MKSKFKIVFVAILLLVIVLSSCTPQITPTAAPPAPFTALAATLSVQVKQLTLSARLSEIKGKVEIKQAGQDSFSSASANSFLDEKGQVQTGEDGHVRLDLSTGTIIRVAPTSLFTLLSNEPMQGSLKTRLELLLGKIFIILNGGSMEVQTPSGAAAVRGSYMSVNYGPSGEIRITCLEGSCSLSSAGGSVVITAGQTAVVSGAGQPPQIGEMSGQDIQDWLNNNPEANLIAPAAEIPGAMEPPPAQIIPPVEPGPIVFEPPKKYPEPKVPPVEQPLTATPTNTPTDAPTNTPTTPTPTVVINNISPSASAIVGEPVTVIVSVQSSPGGPTPSGTIKVLAYGISFCTATLSAGAATCIGSIPTAGSPNLIADYPGDGNYLAAQSTAWGYAVNKANTTVTITNHTPNPSLVNANVVFIATVDNVPPGAGLPLGSVTFSDSAHPADYCTVNSAPWTCSINFTNSGPRSVTASYSGDTNFNGSVSSSVIQDVLFSANSEFLNIIGPISITLMNNSECLQTYSVKVLDVNGVNQVKMQYRLANSNFVNTDVEIPLLNMGANAWQKSISVPAGSMDVIYWRFIALDGGGNLTYFGDSLAYALSNIGGPAVSAYYFDITSAFSPDCPAIQ